MHKVWIYNLIFDKILDINPFRDGKILNIYFRSSCLEINL